MKRKNSQLVYSTNPDLKDNIDTDQNEAGTTPSRQQTVYIERDRKKRAGKVVTVISGVTGDLKPLLKELQKLCGSGGTAKAGQIEIQGDHREKIAEHFRQKGYKVKFIGS